MTWGLLAAWIVHDIEELATMSSWTRRQSRIPTVTPAESAGAIGVVGAVMAADGARTGGRSRFFQTALSGFGLHALTHLGASALCRGYTPGVLTTPTVVVPYSVWACRDGVSGDAEVVPQRLDEPFVEVLVAGAEALARPVVG